MSVDLEIVLAVDASASVDPREFELQLQGIASAFRDPVIINAIRAGPNGRIAVSLVQWAEAIRPKYETDWHLIDSPRAAEKFARLVERLPRAVTGGTGIGAGMAAAMRKMERNGMDGARRVVDVSGDGTETTSREEQAVTLERARDMARARKVVVNGLAILTDVPDLDKWYAEHVTVGPGSFVMAAGNYQDFQRAFRNKLLREIQPPLANLAPDRRDSAADFSVSLTP